MPNLACCPSTRAGEPHQRPRAALLLFWGALSYPRPRARPHVAPLLPSRSTGRRPSLAGFHDQPTEFEDVPVLAQAPNLLEKRDAAAPTVLASAAIPASSRQRARGAGLRAYAPPPHAYPHALQVRPPRSPRPPWPHIAFNALGLPRWPGEPPCAHFLRWGTCAYGHICRYDHPDARSA